MLAIRLVQTVEYRLRRADGTYRDAARFWGLPETASGDAVDQTLAKVPATLAAAVA